MGVVYTAREVAVQALVETAITRMQSVQLGSHRQNVGLLCSFLLVSRPGVFIHLSGRELCELQLLL